MTERPIVSHRSGSGLLAALVMTAAGCASGPDYRAAAVPAAAAGAFVSPATRAVAHGAELPDDWWRLYEDASLDALVQTALAANTDLRIAQANLDRAQAMFREARSAQWPATTVSGSAQYGRDAAASSGPGRAPVQWSYSGGLQLAYEVDLFGRVRRDIEAAQHDAGSMAAARDAARVAVVAETTRAYVEACTLGESIAIARESVTLTSHSLELVTQKWQAGSASRLDVERAGASAARARAALPPLQGQRQATLFELTALLGRPPAAVPGTAAQCLQAPVLRGPMPVGDGAALLRRRPDIRQAEHRLAADTARIGIAVADLYPRITLGATGSRLRNDAGNQDWSFALGPLISWHFPNVMAARSRVGQAKARPAASLAAFDGTVLTALKETEQALTIYDASLSQHEALRDARDRAGRAYRLADQRWRAGAIAYLDVLLAQADHVEARARLAASALQVGNDRVTLFRALGGGWTAAAVPPYPPSSDR